MAFDIFVYATEFDYLHMYRGYLKDSNFHSPVNHIYFSNNHFLVTTDMELPTRPDLNRNSTTTDLHMQKLMAQAPQQFKEILPSEIVYNPKHTALDFKPTGWLHKPTFRIHINKFFGDRSTPKSAILKGVFVDIKRSRYNFIIS